MTSAVVKRVALAALFLVAVVMPVGFGGAATPALTLNGISDRGADGEGHAFELYGNFASPASVRPVVSCGGRLMDAEVMGPDEPVTPPPVVVQINVNVESMAGGSSCSFSLQRFSDGTRSRALTIVPSAPPIEIRGVNDRGVTGGQRYVELYGGFQRASALEPRVLCSGRYVAARVEFASSGQVNVSLASTVAAAACAFALRDPGSGLTSPTFGALPAPVGFVPGFGGYVWVPIASESLSAGQAGLNALGVDATRLRITPRVRSGEAVENWYGFDLEALNTACPLAKAFLPCAIRWAPYQKAISAPRLRTVILSAYDSASSGPTGQQFGFVDPAFWTSPTKRAAVGREYRDLTYALFQTQHDTGKTFVIASWEADNQAYCGSFVYWYQDKPGFRATCGNISIASRDAAISALTQWFEARQAGIKAGIKLAAAAGYGGVTVADGIEFNINPLTYSYKLGNTTLKTVLRNVVPTVKPRFVVYSAYDSQNSGHMEQDLRQLKSWLTTNAAGARLLIGEAGYPRHGVDATAIFRTVATAKAIQRVGLRAAILWEAYDTWNDRMYPYGMLHPNGTPRRVLRVLSRELAAQAVELAAPHPVRILAATDRGVSDDAGTAYRYYELYGTFPRSGYSASAFCDGIATLVQVVYESEGQINVRIAHRNANRYCTIRLQRADGVRSLEFGPVVA